MKFLDPSIHITFTDFYIQNLRYFICLPSRMRFGTTLTSFFLELILTPWLITFTVWNRVRTLQFRKPEFHVNIWSGKFVLNFCLEPPQFFLNIPIDICKTIFWIIFIQVLPCVVSKRRNQSLIETPILKLLLTFSPCLWSLKLSKSLDDHCIPINIILCAVILINEFLDLLSGLVKMLIRLSSRFRAFSLILL